MEIIRKREMETLVNPGVRSLQLLSTTNSESRRLAITSVTVEAGGRQGRHSHEASEQVWLAIQGSGHLLLGEGRTLSFEAGDVARFCEGDVHGLLNDSGAPFQYISVTAPPADFRAAYESKERP